MSANEYRFITRWRVEGSCGEVADILGDATAMTRWWPSVYLDAEELQPPEAGGLGRRVRLHTKGWLPYTLRWDLEVVASRYPHGFTIRASGDFDGVGVWTFEQDGRFVNIAYDWRIRAEQPLLRYFSLPLRPLFEANHRWAMREGEKSLALELARRRTTTEAARAAIPPPPGPVTYSGVVLVAGVATVAGLTAAAVWTLGRRAGRARGH